MGRLNVQLEAPRGKLRGIAWVPAEDDAVERVMDAVQNEDAARVKAALLAILSTWNVPASAPAERGSGESNE